MRLPDQPPQRDATSSCVRFAQMLRSRGSSTFFTGGQHGIRCKMKHQANVRARHAASARSFIVVISASPTTTLPDVAWSYPHQVQSSVFPDPKGP